MEKRTSPKPRVNGLRHLSLREAAWWVLHIEVQCRKCGRYGRYPIKAAIARWGEYCDVWDIVEEVSKDCPKKGNTDPYYRCGANSPTYLKVPAKEGGRG